MKKDVAIIVDKLPPPGAKGGAAPADDGGGEDYSAAQDSMSAFMDALKGDDVQAALDAWADVKANC